MKRGGEQLKVVAHNDGVVGFWFVVVVVVVEGVEG